MFDNLAAYYHQNVVSGFIEYRERSRDGLAGKSRDLRAALTAATALFHLREHLPKPSALSRADVERACPDYGLLGDIVNAAKHKTITSKTPHGEPLVNDATRLEEQILLIEYEDAAGPYRYVQKTVLVRLIDGSERNLLEVLTNVLNFWERQMEQLGVLKAARTFTYDGDVRFRSRVECEGSKLDFELIQGQGANSKQTLRPLRFDQRTRKAAPIDLAGAKARLRICAPIFDIDIFLTHKASGREFQTTISLTDEESEALSNMSSDAERRAFVHALPSAMEALKRLAVEAGLEKREPD